MGELIGAGMAVVVFGGLIWLWIRANRSLKAQSSNPMLRRSRKDRSSARVARISGGHNGGMM